MSASSIPNARRAFRAAVARDEPFAAVILDAAQPGSLELAAELHDGSLGPEPGKVLVTPFGQRLDSNLACGLGVSDVIARPLRNSSLRRSLRRALHLTPSSHETGQHAPVVDSVPAPLAFHKRAVVLVAEDNAVNQKVAIRLLDRLGYRCDVVANGAEALEALGRIEYAAVLMDCMMPVMDGYAATRAVRREEGKRAGGARTPIIAMTANAMAGERAHCLAAGMDDYITKPVSREELSLVLGRWIDGPQEDPSSPAPISREVALQDTRPVLLDSSLLEGLKAMEEGEDDRFVAEVVELFLIDGPVRLEALRSALAEGVGESLSNAAHTLKGTAANLGAVRLRLLCEQLEQGCQSAGLSPLAAGELIGVIELTYQELAVVLSRDWL